MRDRAMAMVVRNGKILMVETHRSNRRIFELPGGGIEKGESPQEAALRELKEECGLCGTIERQLNILHRINGSTEYVFLVNVSPDCEPIVGSDPEIAAGAEQAIKNVRFMELTELSEKDRAFLWSYGLLDVDNYFDIVLSWGDEISYPDSCFSGQKVL